MYNVASLIVTASVLLLLAFVALCLRFYVRLGLNHTKQGIWSDIRDHIGIDDWLILIAFVFVCGQCANQITSAKIGELGRDGEPENATRLAYQSKLDYAVLIFEKGTYTTIKLSVLFFYRRIFKSSRTFKILNTTLIIIIIIWGVTFLFVPAFLCGADSNHGHPCPQTEWESLWFGITDVIGDVAVLCLPYPILRSLQMDRRQKIGVCAIFLLGTISLIMGIVRLGFVAKTFAVYFHPSVLPTSPSRTPPTFWTTIEVCTGVLAACLPPCSPLLRLGAQKLVSSKYLSRPSPLEERPSFGFGAGKPVGNSFGSSRSSGASGGKETGREKYEIDQVEVFGMKDMV